LKLETYRRDDDARPISLYNNVMMIKALLTENGIIPIKDVECYINIVERDFA
jgi:hypothetical protein